MRTQELAPAKINLALDILGRRADGYHELRMVMQTVSLCDVITVEEGGTGFTLLTGEAFSLPADKVSMEQRAAEAFFARHGGKDVPMGVLVPDTISKMLRKLMTSPRFRNMTLNGTQRCLTIPSSSSLRR